MLTVSAAQVDSLQQKLMATVDGILAVHEFHIWQLAGDRIIASAHIRCLNLAQYMQVASLIGNCILMFLVSENLMLQRLFVGNLSRGILIYLMFCSFFFLLSCVN